MSGAAASPNGARAQVLRAEFDAGFAAPLPPPPPPMAALLLVQAGEKRVAIRRAQIGSIARAEGITPVPGPSATLLGVTALRGQLHPVWSLARLLHADAPTTETERWLVCLAGGDDLRCALACEAIGQSISVPEAALVVPARRPGDASYIPALVPWDSALLPLVDLAALQATLRRDPPPSPSSP